MTDRLTSALPNSEVVRMPRVHESNAFKGKGR